VHNSFSFESHVLSGGQAGLTNIRHAGYFRMFPRFYEDKLSGNL